MSPKIKSALLLTFVFFTFFINAIQWYTHTETYPLSAMVGPEQFIAYASFYEQ